MQQAVASVDDDFIWVHFGEGEHVVVHHPIRGTVTAVGAQGIHIDTTEAIGEVGIGERVIVSVVTT